MSERWRRLLRVPGRSIRSDVDEELDFHVQAMADAHVRSGMARDEALRRARVEFGDVDRAAALCRRIDEQHQRRVHATELLGSWWRDARQATRTLTRDRTFAITALGTLALAVATTTAVFTLVDAVFRRPFPFPHPERLMALNMKAPRWNLDRVGINYPDFHAWRVSTTSFEAIGYIEGGSFNLADGGRAERVDGAWVTRDLPAALGVTPLLGRTFTEEEDRPGGPRVVMISRSLWRDRFGEAADVIGRTLFVHGRQSTIVGVMPDQGIFVERAKVYLPLAGDPNQSYQSYSGEGIARLKAGVTAAQALADLLHAHEPIWARLDTARVVTPILLPLREEVTRTYRGAGGMLGGGVAFILLIAIANVASILLARGVVRQHELAVRKALGASGVRVGRQLFVEALVLSVVAGALGTLAGHWAVQLLVRLAGDRLPSWANVGFSASSALFALAVVLVAAVLSALAPIAFGRVADLRTTMGAGGRHGSSPRAQRRLLDGLVVLEVGLCLVLLAGSVLVASGVRRLREVRPGFRVENTLAFNLSLPSAAYERPLGVFNFYDRLLGELEALPGVSAAGAISCRPLGCHQGNFTEVEGRAEVAGEDTPVQLTLSATPRAFDALGIELLKGRPFDDQDGRPGKAQSVVVSEAYARWAWPDGSDPTGRRIRRAGRDSPWWTVVGVTRDVRHYGLERPPRPTVYLPSAMAPREDMAVILHTRVDPASLVGAVREVVTRLDPSLPLYQVTTMDNALRDSLGLVRTVAWLLAVFAGIALALAVGGLFGVLSYTVSQRQRDIAIRMALGAGRGSIVRSVVRRGLGLTAVGLAIGLPAALWVSHLAGGQLPVAQGEPTLPLATAVAIMVVCGTCAALVPARRAARVAEHGALRSE